MSPGACSACILSGQCHPNENPCWCCPWPTVYRTTLTWPRALLAAAAACSTSLLPFAVAGVLR